MTATRSKSGSSASDWRYACHVGVGLLVAALLTRTWLVQGLIVPIELSAGSMAPAYLGPHRMVRCDACSFRFACGLDRLPAGGDAVCPNCGERGNDLAHRADRLGTRVLLDRTAFARRPPRRWESIVFRCPAAAQQYCLKRVVGLPGEAVEIRQGDIFVDGRIARKTLDQTRAMKLLVHDAAFVPAAASASAPRWQPRAAASHWREIAPGHFKFDSGRAKAGPLDWLEFRPLDDRPMTDDIGYNQGETRRLNLIQDVGLSAVIEAAGTEAAGSGVLALQAVDGAESFEVRLDPPSGLIELHHNGRRAARASIAPDRLRKTVLELFLVDRRLLLAVGGETMLAYPYRRGASDRTRSNSPLAIGASRLAVELTQLRVWRDVYYTYTDPGVGRVRRGIGGPYSLAAAEFFVLGDNSPISQDSRTLPSGGIPAKLIVGKPLLRE